MIKNTTFLTQINKAKTQVVLTLFSWHMWAIYALLYIWKEIKLGIQTHACLFFFFYKFMYQYTISWMIFIEKIEQNHKINPNNNKSYNFKAKNMATAANQWQRWIHQYNNVNAWRSTILMINFASLETIFNIRKTKNNVNWPLGYNNPVAICEVWLLSVTVYNNKRKR